MAKKLSTYAKRRNVKRSKEPPAKVASSRGNPSFVVQQHAARAMHYDLRLEVDGVMKSWAIPKGPSLNPQMRRLAVLTDDHPLSYKNFEGVIPKGEYGAGKVIVWDRGRYQNIKKNKQGKPLTMKGAFRQGTIEIVLKGKKLKGAFALVRMSGKNWLLIKMKDAHADLRKNIVKSEPYSVKSGKKIQEIK
ncbi:MAG: DNA ligase [Chlamydiia bacterium]|nr:DNA ligase [Chlamydiia bacterium]